MSRFNPRRAFYVGTLTAFVGVVAVIIISAASTPIAFEPETGSLASGATTTTITGQSGAGAVKFAASTGSPSGEPMPVGNLAGWTQTMTDDFTGTTLNSSKWYTPYNGPIPSAPGGLWDKDHAVVADGMLKLLGYKEGDTWVTAGVMNTNTQTYGKYLVRFRMDKGSGIKYVALLWPAAPDTWYTGGEIDFTEDGGGNRTGTTATVIWFADKTAATKNQIQKPVSGDFSVWHTMGVEWSPGKLVYTMDGVPFGTVENTAAVPSGPMKLAIQTEALVDCSSPWGTCVGATTPANVNMEIDWVSIYSKN